MFSEKRTLLAELIDEKTNNLFLPGNVEYHWKKSVFCYWPQYITTPYTKTPHEINVIYLESLIKKSLSLLYYIHRSASL